MPTDTCGCRTDTPNVGLPSHHSTQHHRPKVYRVSQGEHQGWSQETTACSTIPPVLEISSSNYTSYHFEGSVTIGLMRRGNPSNKMCGLLAQTLVVPCHTSPHYGYLFSLQPQWTVPCTVQQHLPSTVSQRTALLCSSGFSLKLKPAQQYVGTTTQRLELKLQEQPSINKRCKSVDKCPKCPLVGQY